ncbi:MAG: hypothetical protein KGS72_25680 [Cyanobacteria bacterium REEB67]|nr:hypothetical protein [Cyanobacteria bacterium REEB67]
MSNEVNHANDSTVAATGKPDDVAGKLLADATPAAAPAGADAKPTAAPLAIDNGQAPVITDKGIPVDLFPASRSEISPATAPEAGVGKDAVAAPAQADAPAVKGDRLAPAAATSPFGQLEITDTFKAVGDDKPLSPNMTEARRIEDQYRGRYSENDKAMKAVGSVIGANNPDINGDITKDSLDKALANAKTAAPDDARYGKDFQAGAQYLKDNWNDLSISPYKAMDGSINQKSAEDGTSRMTGEQDALAKRILATEMNAVNREKAQAASPGADAKPSEPQAPALEPKEAIIDQSRTRLGEGPYQVAARVLGSDGKALNDKQLKELTEAFKQSYEEQRKQHPEMHDLMGLKVGHEFITKENISGVLSKISDPALKERLTAIAGQDTAFKPPVITPIPHRPTAAHQTEHPVHHQPKPSYPPLPPARPANFPAHGRS